MNMLRNIWARIESAITARARAEAREQLLRMSDRNLADIGVSRKLLALGIDAWPWREDAATDGEGGQPTDLERNRAIRELQAYSDRELNDLGLSRAGIVDAVTHGRPAGNDADHRRVA